MTPTQEQGGSVRFQRRGPPTVVWRERSAAWLEVRSKWLRSKEESEKEEGGNSRHWWWGERVLWGTLGVKNEMKMKSYAR
ncbi:hypothetical protein NL676_009219 [Syzygium grande]|nr:hypothetical protein NL676_009219 [Syzygium grande]